MIKKGAINRIHNLKKLSMPLSRTNAHSPELMTSPMSQNNKNQYLPQQFKISSFEDDQTSNGVNHSAALSFHQNRQLVHISKVANQSGAQTHKNSPGEKKRQRNNRRGSIKSNNTSYQFNISSKRNSRQDQYANTQGQNFNAKRSSRSPSNDRQNLMHRSAKNSNISDEDFLESPSSHFIRDSSPESEVINRRKQKNGRNQLNHKSFEKISVLPANEFQPKKQCSQNFDPIRKPQTFGENIDLPPNSAGYHPKKSGSGTYTTTANVQSSTCDTTINQAALNNQQKGLNNGSDQIILATSSANVDDSSHIQQKPLRQQTKDDFSTSDQSSSRLDNFQFKHLSNLQVPQTTILPDQYIQADQIQVLQNEIEKLKVIVQNKVNNPIQELLAVSPNPQVRTFKDQRPSTGGGFSSHIRQRQNFSSSQQMETGSMRNLFKNSQLNSSFQQQPIDKQKQRNAESQAYLIPSGYDQWRLQANSTKNSKKGSLEYLQQKELDALMLNQQIIKSQPPKYGLKGSLRLQMENMSKARPGTSGSMTNSVSRPKSGHARAVSALRRNRLAQLNVLNQTAFLNEMNDVTNKHIMLEFNPNKGRLGFIQGDQEIEVDEIHYQPMFIAKDVEELRQNPETHKALKKFKIFTGVSQFDKTRTNQESTMLQSQTGTFSKSEVLKNDIKVQENPTQPQVTEDKQPGYNKDITMVMKDSPKNSRSMLLIPMPATQNNSPRLKLTTTEVHDFSQKKPNRQKTQKKKYISPKDDIPIIKIQRSSSNSFLHPFMSMTSLDKQKEIANNKDRRESELLTVSKLMQIKKLRRESTNEGAQFVTGGSGAGFHQKISLTSVLTPSFTKGGNQQPDTPSGHSEFSFAVNEIFSDRSSSSFQNFSEDKKKSQALRQSSKHLEQIKKNSPLIQSSNLTNSHQGPINSQGSKKIQSPQFISSSKRNGDLLLSKRPITNSVQKDPSNLKKFTQSFMTQAHSPNSPHQKSASDFLKVKQVSCLLMPLPVKNFSKNILAISQNPLSSQQSQVGTFRPHHY